MLGDFCAGAAWAQRRPRKLTPVLHTACSAPSGFTDQSDDADHAALAKWIECDFWPRRFPPLLRLLESVALRRSHAIEGKSVAKASEVPS
jgi:hypothetical protein